MKKVLFSATVDSHILHFHLPFLKLFKEKGYEVHVATNGDEEIPFCDKKIKIPFERSPFKINNLKAIKQLKKVIMEEQYDIIHTHTPMGSVVTRLAAKKARKKYNTRVIYTAHGFHFFKGAPKKNWIMFYPVEKWLSKYTDTLITINTEDYELAKRKFKKCKDIEYVPGVGIDESKFNFEMTKKEKHELRESLGLKDDDFVMIYPAELSERKRQIWLIQSISELMNKNKNIHLLLPGKDSLNGKCQKLVQDLNLDKQIHFLGYRKDIPYLLKISNLAVSSANQEGLPVNIMEAMYVGLPIVASNCRGNRDLVEDGKNGFLVDLSDSDKFMHCIKNLSVNRILSSKFGNYSIEIIKKYLLFDIMIYMTNIYNNNMKIEKKSFLYFILLFRKKIQLKYNSFLAKSRNKRLNKKNITIISNNCFGGVAYEYLNLPFNSPTIGLYFFAPEYIKFIKNIKKYVSKNLESLNIKDSKYYNELKKLHQSNVILGQIGDVEIVFLHYNSFNEAKEKWMRRCGRINYDQIIYKFNDQNLCTEEELEEFNRLKLNNKLCFTAKKYNYDGFIQLKKYKNKKFVLDDVFNYHKEFNIIKFINEIN